MKNWWRADENWWRTDKELMKSWWRTDEGLTKNWQRTDEELMKNWWRTDEELMKDWWRTDEELMINWWRTDEGLMKDWWQTDDELIKYWWQTYDELMTNWSSTDQVITKWSRPVSDPLRIVWNLYRRYFTFVFDIGLLIFYIWHDTGTILNNFQWFLGVILAIWKVLSVSRKMDLTDASACKNSERSSTSIIHVSTLIVCFKYYANG